MRGSLSSELPRVGKTPAREPSIAKPRQLQVKRVAKSLSDSSLLSRGRTNLDQAATSIAIGTSSSRDPYWRRASDVLEGNDGQPSSPLSPEPDGEPQSPISPKSWELCLKSLPSMSKLPKLVASRASSNSRRYNQWRSSLQRAMCIETLSQEATTTVLDATSQGLRLETEPYMSEEHADIPQALQQLSASAPSSLKRGSRLSLAAAAAENKAEWIPPPNPIEGLPSAKDCVERYFQPPPIMPGQEEMKRMRRCFFRFKPKKHAEVSTGNLPMILDLLGFYVRDWGDEPLLRYDNLHFDDFCDAVSERIVPAERKMLGKLISGWKTDSGTREKALHEFMHMLKVPCTYKSVQMTMLSGLLYNSRLNAVPDSSREVLRFLACRRSCEGFTPEEMTNLQEAFAACDGHEDNHIPATELSNALLEFAGLNCVDLLKELMNELVPDAKDPVSFGEFVAFARILQTRQMRVIEKHMKNEDADGDGLISVSELRSTMVGIGYRLTNLEFKERLLESLPHCAQGPGDVSDSVVSDSESDKDPGEALAKSKKPEQQSDSRLDFDTVWQFVQDCWECKGFAEEEHAYLTNIFERFCGESDEMAIVAVHNLLSYMGHENSLEKTQSLAQMVDYNGNGTMDVDEFLTLMRLQKEDNLKAYVAAYEAEQLSHFHIDLHQKVLTALDACNLSGLPEDTVCQMLRSVREGDSHTTLGLSFDSFVRLGEMYREIVPKQKRKQASFSIAEVQDLLVLFDSYATPGSVHLNQREFYALTSDCPELVSTSSVKRNRLLNAVGKARENAKEAGVEESELGDANMNTIRFIPFIYLIRGLLDKHDQKVNEKLGAALIETGFTSAEVSEFREMFNSLAGLTTAKQATPREKGSSKAGAGTEAQNVIRRRSRRKSSAFMREKGVEAPPVEVVKPVVKSLATQMAKFTYVPHVAAENLSTLVRSQAGISGKELGQFIVSVKCPAGVDFPGFLRLMGWVAKNSSALA